MGVSQPSRTTGKAGQAVLQQAPVEPLDAFGLTASVVGTILFALATFICWRIGHWDFWTYVCATGGVLGFVLIPYTAVRRHRAHRPRPRR